MTDIQHNISDDHIIKNTTDIGNDYKFANHNVDPSRDQPAGMVLFRLLTPGPSNLRGRTEAYQVSISTGLAAGPSSNVTSKPLIKISDPVPALVNVAIVAAAAVEEYAHIEGPAGGAAAPVGEQPTQPAMAPGEVSMAPEAAGPMLPGEDAPDFGGGGGGMGPYGM